MLHHYHLINPGAFVVKILTAIANKITYHHLEISEATAANGSRYAYKSYTTE